MRTRRTNTDPLRDVVEARRRNGALSLCMPQLKNYWWELVLSCGHEVERPCKYPPYGPGGGPMGWARHHHGRPSDQILPAPKRARCDVCGNAIRRGDVQKVTP